MSYHLKELTIELTQQCLNSCLFCSSRATRRPTFEITRNEARKVASEAKDLGLETISISGGEPLCHAHLFKIIDDFLSIGLNVRLYTTGLRLLADMEAAPFTNWESLDTNRVHLIFNIQSSDGACHDMLSGRKGAFCGTRKSLLSAKGKGFRTEVHIVPNKINLPSLEQTVLDLDKWGVDQISFLRLVPQGCARDNASRLLLDEAGTDRLKSVFARLRQNPESTTPLRFGIPFSGFICAPKACNAGESKLIIRYDGKILPCEAFKDERCSDFVLGDIRCVLLSHAIDTAANNRSLISLKKSTANFNEACIAQELYTERRI
jgi:radical SAM protein with 4Fe4S-binding SPASM domain